MPKQTAIHLSHVPAIASKNVNFFSNKYQITEYIRVTHFVDFSSFPQLFKALMDYHQYGIWHVRCRSHI